MAPPDKSTKKKSPKFGVKDLPNPPSVLEQEISSLSAPPARSLDILTRPPFPESPAKPPVHEQDSIIIQDNITSDILKELRQGEFGSILRHVPEKRPLTLDEIEGPRFLAAKDDYLAAGKKHLELNFYENAAMNFACAILSMYLGKDVFAAAHLMSELASTLPPTVVNSYFFQGAKLFLKGILLKTRSSIIQSEKWLLKDTNYLYKEDTDLIRRALRQSEMSIRQS